MQSETDYLDYYNKPNLQLNSDYFVLYAYIAHVFHKTQLIWMILDAQKCGDIIVSFHGLQPLFVSEMND